MFLTGALIMGMMGAVSFVQNVKGGGPILAGVAAYAAYWFDLYDKFR